MNVCEPSISILTQSGQLYVTVGFMTQNHVLIIYTTA